MSWDEHRDSAEPDGSIGGPPEINLFSWKDVLVERSSDRARENIAIIDRISFRITVQHIKQSVEVVRVLIDMNHCYGPLGTRARAGIGWPPAWEPESFFLVRNRSLR